MTDIVKSMHDPASAYAFPKDVVDDATLTLEQKIRILKQWEYDARELQVAEEENMVGSDASMLSRVLKALHALENDVK